jgi:hypothetical protein
MSSVEQRKGQAGIQRLNEEISTLAEQQAAAEKMAALVGMTIDDSEQYKRRHSRIKKLTQKLAALGGQQLAPSQAVRHESKEEEAQETAWHGREGDQVHSSR